MTFDETTVKAAKAGRMDWRIEVNAFGDFQSPGDWQTPGAELWRWHLATVANFHDAERALRGRVCWFAPTEIQIVRDRRPGAAAKWKREGRKGPPMRKATRPLFPGYRFCAPHACDWMEIDRAEGVGRVIRLAGDPLRPACMPGWLMLGLFDRQLGVSADLRRPVARRAALPVGTRVRVTDGPLAGFCGLIEATPRAERVRVLVAMFGAQTPVEMDAGQVALADGA